MHTSAADNGFGQLFIHAQAAGQHAASGIGNAQRFQRSLHRSVLAVGSVEGEQREIQAFYRINQLFPRMNDNRYALIFAAVQMLQHFPARIQRHLIFRGYPAHNHAYFFHSHNPSSSQ
ncbi:hypothetical protein D3C85_1385210 [compost metagenome]